jgi:hypothetical protein
MPVFRRSPYRTIFFLVFCLSLFSRLCAGTVEDTLCTPNASPEARALYRYLLDMKGKLILSGQQDSPWGIDEFAYLRTNTGKQPAIKGMDFIHQADNASEVQKAADWWKKGGIPTIMWHWGAPSKGEGYEQSKMAIDIDRCFIEGTAEYTAFRAELKLKADLLQVLRDAHVPVLWRPYHELNGSWFWWGKQGPERFKRLWIAMFDYFVHERGLNNLIWVLCYTDNPQESWYPGDEYVDIAGADTYDNGDGPQMGMFNKVKTITADKFPIAYHECGIPPVPDQCILHGGIWSWWMEWHTDWLAGVDKAYLREVYSSELVVTFDELPDIMSLYAAVADSCPAPVLVPWIQLDSSAWEQKELIVLGSATSALLRVETADQGTWSWSGMGTAGDTSMQRVSLEKGGTAFVRFTNTCGASASLAFHAADPCPGTAIIPFIQVQSGPFTGTDSASILQGQSVSLSPQAEMGGSWSWSGAANGSSRIVTFSPDTSCEAVVSYKNTCGKTSRLVFKIRVKPTGIKEEGNTREGMKVFPSPCKDFLWVALGKTSGTKECRYSVISMQGSRVLDGKMEAEGRPLDVSGLVSGIYHLRVQDGISRYSCNFLKIQ